MTSSQSTNIGKTLVIISGVGLIIGALLPWGSVRSIFGTVSIMGYEGDGIFTGIAGLILLIIGLKVSGQPGKIYSAASGIIGFLVIVLLGYKWESLSKLAAGDNSVNISIGAGIYLSFIAALLGTLGGFTTLPKIEPPAIPAETPPNV